MSGPYYSEGMYRFQVAEQGFGEFQGGTPYFFLRGSVRASVTQDGDCECDKHYEREIRLGMTDDSIEYVVAKLQTIGWNAESWKDLHEGGSVSFVGQTVVAKCSHNPGRQDPTKTFEAWDLPWGEKKGGDRPPKPKSDPKVASKLDVMFGKALKKDAKATAPKAPVKPPVPVAAAESDIPF